MKVSMILKIRYSKKILARARNFNFNPNHIAGVRDEIADALSRLCGIVSKTEHSPDDNLSLLPMSKKAEIYKKKLEIQDPLVKRLGDIGGENFEYVGLLQRIENQTEYKHLPDDCELRLICNSIPRLGIAPWQISYRVIP